MTAKLNHTIIWSHDKQTSALLLSEILGLPSPTTVGHFVSVETANEVTLDFLNTDREIAPQHYAFLVSEAEFDDIFTRIREQNIRYWADPMHQRAGVINTRDGGRGLYFADPNGHNMEILTRPYGGG